jgi:hypothetical protein
VTPHQFEDPDQGERSEMEMYGNVVVFIRVFKGKKEGW